jgi:hypothetical protein
MNPVSMVIIVTSYGILDRSFIPDKGMDSFQCCPFHACSAVYLAGIRDSFPTNVCCYYYCYYYYYYYYYTYCSY